MNDADVIVEQAEIIERLTEVNKQLSDLVQDILPLLAQYQTVDAEERRFNEIKRPGGGHNSWEA